MNSNESGTTPTAKRIAAAILLEDLEIVTDYWTERTDMDAIPSGVTVEEINEQMEAILRPFIERIHKIAKDVRTYNLK